LLRVNICVEKFDPTTKTAWCYMGAGLGKSNLSKLVNKNILIKYGSTHS